jgi:hypothetical protein
MKESFFKDRRGYALPYSVVLIGLVAMPLLVLTSEIVRSLYVNVHIQTAVDSACSAAVQAVNVPYFVDNGVIRIDSSLAASYARREFNATVTRSNIEHYNPVLTSIAINGNVVNCRASAQMNWSLPGIRPLTFNVLSAAEAEARR